MGISGLLPALKSIQKTKHLSEFKGQTIAVDAYVWLHKGVYSCATELATGKPTHKYVDYAMHRVRLLRHFAIEPYIVFDGGPLPAKKGTESERKQRREENLSRGKALAAQGKHSQARDCFVKCVDVTPQMAYQLIKVLRAENVQHVVAPYEADAQLAYLERVGLVSAILTEDSDLLVFGCKSVLFKFDHVANTVRHISRTDFGAVRSTGLDASSINLHGWNDTQFRAMAILSGCDYLPSIPGIGLKTANSLLRKWKSAEAVIRAIILEGKKSVPNGYIEHFNLAEKCFLFQRVYDPLEKKLVHLTDIEGEWDEKVDAYVGEDIDPDLATKIALGNVDPVTRLPMNDINPNYKPRTLKKLERTSKEPTTPGILGFFGPHPIIPRESSVMPRSSIKPTPTGAWSGKRRLGDIMDHDLAMRKECLAPQVPVHSKFFSMSAHRESTPKRHSGRLVAGPSPIPEDSKENACFLIDDDNDADDDLISTLSIHLNVSPTQDLDLDDPHDEVEQEDGYMSPFSSYSPEAQDLSSPAVNLFSPLKKQKRKSSSKTLGQNGENKDLDDEGVIILDEEGGEGDSDVEPISSPVSTIKRSRQSWSFSRFTKRTSDGIRLQTPTRSFSAGNVLVPATPSRESLDHSNGAAPHIDVFGHYAFLGPKPTYKGPDLQSCLGVEDGAGTDEDQIALDSRHESQHVKSHDAAATSLPFVSHRSTDSSDSKPVSGSDQESGPISTSGLKLGQIAPQPLSSWTAPDNVNAHATVKNKKFSVSIDTVGEIQEKIVIDADALEVAEGSETEMEVDDPEENAMRVRAERLKRVAKGWRMRWALGQLQREDSSSASSAAEQQTPAVRVRKRDRDKNRRQSAPMMLATNRLKRNETNVTPLGKHSLANKGTNRPLPHPHQQTLTRAAPSRQGDRIGHLQAPSSAGKIDGDGGQQQELRKPSSLIFFADHKITPLPKAAEPLGPKNPMFRDLEAPELAEECSDDEIAEISRETWTTLYKFRYQ